MRAAQNCPTKDGVGGSGSASHSGRSSEVAACCRVYVSVPVGHKVHSPSILLLFESQKGDGPL